MPNKCFSGKGFKKTKKKNRQSILYLVSDFLSIPHCGPLWFNIKEPLQNDILYLNTIRKAAIWVVLTITKKKKIIIVPAISTIIQIFRIY